MKTITACLVLFLVAGLCFADDSDDTLKRWLSKSELVVLGTIVSEPIGFFSEAGVPHYSCQFKVSDVCKGDSKLKDKTINLSIARFEMHKKDHHPLIKKGAECILFLKNVGTEKKPGWVTTDFWFGIQHPIPWMAKSLTRLATIANAAEAPSVPDLSKGIPGATLEKKENNNGAETFHLSTALSSKQFSGRLQTALGAGWTKRKITKDDMILAAQKGRSLNAEVNLAVYANPKLPSITIRVLHFKYKKENAGTAAEIAVIRSK